MWSQVIVILTPCVDGRARLYVRTLESLAKIVGFVYYKADGKSGSDALDVVYPEESAPAPSSLPTLDRNCALPDLRNAWPICLALPDWDELVTECTSHGALRQLKYES